MLGGINSGIAQSSLKYTRNGGNREFSEKKRRKGIIAKVRATEGYAVTPHLPSRCSDMWGYKQNAKAEVDSRSNGGRALGQHQHAATKVRVIRPRRLSDPLRSDCMHATQC